MRNFNRDKPFKKPSTENLVYGLRPVIEAIEAGKEFEKLYVQNGLSGEIFRELKALLAQREVAYQYVPIEKLNGLTRSNHQGVAGYLSPITYQSIENILPFVFEQARVPLLLMLDRVTDVRNFGAIARSAECAGVDAIIIPSRGAAQIGPDAIKTSAGALHKIPVCREHNLKQTIDYLQQSGVQVVACSEKADKFHFQANLSTPTVIIMGSEEDGISSEYLKRADEKVKIPMHGTIQSLNVSVACGIILFEAIRQRI